MTNWYLSEKISEDTKKVNLSEEQIKKYKENAIQYMKELSELNRKYNARIYEDEADRYVVLEDNDMQIFFEEYYDDDWDEYYDDNGECFYKIHDDYCFYGVHLLNN